MNSINSHLVQHLQAQQPLLLDAVYAAMRDSECDPSDSYKKHALSAAQSAYDQSVLRLQAVHPDRAECPANYCDISLYQFFSDFHKDAYGFRYRGDMSCAEMHLRMPQMQLDLIANEAHEAEYSAHLDQQEQLYMADLREEQAVNHAYCTDFDHHDPRLAA